MYQARGCLPAMDWQVGFNHMLPVKKIKYLLILVDTFTGWVEAFPITNKRASTVATILVTDIIPWFGLPASIQSDNGPEFISSISQNRHKPKYPLEISHPLSLPILRQG
jgi:hypothetical protein